jgi:hypothetical protein
MDYPERLGSFLWSENPVGPTISRDGRHWVGVMPQPECVVSRFIESSKDGQGWVVVDIRQSTQRIANVAFFVRWQFAPGASIKRRSERSFVVSRQGVEITVRPGEDWAEVMLVETPAEREKLEPENPLAGIVSPAFRRTVFAPYLVLVARLRSDKPCVFRTTFLASPDS